MFHRGVGTFCQIETITNGTLVRYTAVCDPNKVSQFNPQEQFKEKIADEVRKELSLEFRSLRREDVVLFCKDAAETMKAVNEAYESEQRRIAFEGVRSSVGLPSMGDYLTHPPTPTLFEVERF